MLYLFFLILSAPVNVEVEILNGDVVAARDLGQKKAFEKAVEQTFSEATPSDLRAQRLKSPSRYIKSYRLQDEKRLGEKLLLTYDIELQDLDQGVQNDAAPLPDASMPSLSKELRFEIVFVQRFPAAEVVDQLTTQMKLNVTSFRLTRSAVILKVQTDRAVTQVQQEMQAFIGARGQVNYVNEEIGVPMPLAPEVPILEPIQDAPAVESPLPVQPFVAPMAAPAPAPSEPLPIVEGPEPVQENQVTPPPPPPAPEPVAPAKPEWKPVRPEPWTPPIFQPQKRQ